MLAFPVRDFSTVVFRSGQEGLLLMLRACFDDSGTHARSEAVVWGGVIGSVEQFALLENLWDMFLAEPADGKPRIKKFSASDCKSGRNEFDGWEQGARDLARRNARQIIARSQVVPVAYAVPLKSFNKIIRGRVLRAFGPASGMAFAACADTALKLARKRNEAVACVFDIGQSSPDLDSLLADNLKRAQSEGISISHTFQAVADNYGLQASDTIATEHYWYALQCLRSGDEQPDPHMKALVRDTKPFGFLMDEADMRSLRDRYLKAKPLRRVFGWLR